MIQGRFKKSDRILDMEKQKKSFFTHFKHGNRVLVLLILISAGLFLYKEELTGKEQLNQPFSIFVSQSDARKTIMASLKDSITKNKRPEKIDLDDQSAGQRLNLFEKDGVEVKYSFDPELQYNADKLLRQYKPDYGAIVMMDAKTGQVLAMSSFVKNDAYADNLAVKATFPAASIFKVITASTAVDRKGVDPTRKIAFNGGNYTLYKKNVLSEKVNKWTRVISLKDAFAKSINTAFGRLALESLDPNDLSEYSKRFMFNKYIPSDFFVEPSQAYIPTEKGFELTQVASGYNRYNTLSPVHGAMIAASIINSGKIVAPYVVSQLRKNGQLIYQAEPYEIGQAITPESAQKVQEMMEQTVLTGTSRKAFRQMLRDKKFKQVDMGGKTGHFSGINPKGRNDWFVGYATDGDNKIAVAAITVSVKKWTVKSSALGEMMIRKHFKSILEEKEITKKLNRPSRDSGQSHLADLKSDKT